MSTRAHTASGEANPLQVGLVSADQHGTLVDLLCELHAYYNKTSEVTRSVVSMHLHENLLSSNSPLRLFTAARPDRGVIGFAAVALLYSLVEPAPDKRRQCLLKELFVTSSERSQGVGKALMGCVARYAVQHDCCRIDWPVNAANAVGINFYEGLGAEHIPERLTYRLSRANMDRLAQRVA